jgi:NAD(P)-dependent dehydrogenase (short-subunit alcohol dehydrogenase family)
VPFPEVFEMATVLITGCSKGIGFETALAFGRAGYTVAATTRNPQGAPELGNIASREGLPITVTALDVDDDRSVNEAIRSIGAQIGPIDVLVNNAGIERSSSLEELPLSEYRAVMETNYFGVVRCVLAVLPSMRQRRSGCIINVASVAGHISVSPLGAYSASKYALEAFSECLAQEVKPFNVRVAIVEPGIINTAMAQRIGVDHGPSPYANQRRMAALFAAALKNPAHPSIVGEKILEIAKSDTWKLRHPVGPDAEPFLGWRRAMSDEAWVEFGALDDDAWYDRVKTDFGLEARPVGV